MQKFVETLERTSTEADGERILERIRRLFQSMLCLVKGQDKYSCAVEGVDVVPERQQESKWKLLNEEGYFHKGRIECSLSRIVELLKESNKRVDQWKDDYDSLQR